VEAFWKTFLARIEELTSSQVCETWFRPLQILSLSPEKIAFGVPRKFFADWLNENYKDIIKKVILETTGFTPVILFTLFVKPENGVEEKVLSNDGYEEKKNVLPKNINALYTFSNFVVGSSNQFAHAACRAIANNPGATYNPLFIYGGVGLGKTHLLHAIFHECVNNNQKTRACYVTSEQFTNELINSIRYERMPSFREKYRNIDVMLLDDIQFIAGKERTQEEFFHTFNSLFEIKKQIVVTSDKPPKDIDNLEERLRSRFEWGLIADIQTPDTETKVAILKKKSIANKFVLPNEVAFLLASSVKSNIRELEGLLTRLSAYSSLYGCDITLDFAKDVLRDFIKTAEKETFPEDIQRAISKIFNIKFSDLRSKKKQNSIVLPRQVAMYVIRKMTKLSFPEIGQLFGGKDHSTVIYAIKKVESLMQEDKKIRDIVDSLIKKI